MEKEIRKINHIQIARIGGHPTVKLAVEELRSYFKKIDRSTIVEERVYQQYDPDAGRLLWVGMAEAWEELLPAVPDRQLDDGICIRVTDFAGVITGTNERSVLIAAYRFLKELGVEWLHPGPEGELVPESRLEKCEVQISEAAHMRERVMCIEGADSYEHIFHMIQWLPRVGMNGYFLQFLTPFFFLDRWYSHTDNEAMGPMPFTREDAERIQERISEEIQVRSLRYHAVGHGWTCEPLGIAAEYLETEGESEIPEEIREMFALRDGKRELFGGAACNTNICLSNAKAVDLVSTAVASYCEAHPEVTCLHVWLADMRNNMCECEQCRQYRPSDLYVKLLNRMDEKLTAAQSAAKIYFIGYNDVFWAPLKEALTNPDRFVLMFAPITRNFVTSYGEADWNKLPEEPEFQLNRLEMPRTNPGVMSLMKGWDGFRASARCIFDYHLWSTTLDCDLGGFYIGGILSRDIQAFPKMKVNGLVSCQPQRCSFPNNLPMQVMAQTLWNTETSFEEAAETYCQKYYGRQYRIAYDYLEGLSHLATYWPKYNEQDVMVDEERAKNAGKALEHLAVYEPRIRQAAEGNFAYEIQAQAWRHLVIHTEFAKLILEHQVRKFSGESSAQRVDIMRKVTQKYRETEPELHQVLDAWRQMKGFRE